MSNSQEAYGNAHDKIHEAKKNTKKIMRESSEKIRNATETAWKAHEDRRDAMKRDLAKTLDGTLATLNCDSHCVMKCVDTPVAHNYTYRDSKYNYDKQQWEYFERTSTYFVHKEVDECALHDCHCFDGVIKINRNSLQNFNYANIAEKEYGKPVTQFSTKERAQLARSL